MDYKTVKELYLESTPLHHRKKFAQFFTPPAIARFMLGWLVEGNKRNILEPAFGLGVFSDILLDIDYDVNITAYEVDSTIFRFSSEYFFGNKRLKIIQKSYLDTENSQKYDGIICNPPYLKFHDYDNLNEIQKIERIFNTKLNKMTNLYSLFLLKSISELSPGGRLAYIVPSEFLNSNYGQQIKKILVESGMLRHIFVLDSTVSFFDDATTTATILFLENSSSLDNVSFYNLQSLKELQNDYKSLVPCGQYSNNELDYQRKWKSYYQSQNEDKYKNLVSFNKFAKVKRGIATGANDYFVFNSSKAQQYGIAKEFLLPVLTKSALATSSFFTKKDFNELVNDDRGAFLLNANQVTQSNSVKNYLQKGIEEGIHHRHLTSKRKPWYGLERREVAPILVSVFNRGGLKFVRNDAGVLNLTSFHCIYVNANIDHDVVFAYLLTDTAKEIFLDSSREYGNGLKKFEPNDLNFSKMVDLFLLSTEEKEQIKKWLQQYKDTNDFLFIRQIDCLIKKLFSCQNHSNLLK